MKVKFGLKNVHVFPLTETEGQGAVEMVYGDPIAIPGAVNISLDVSEEDPDPFYADDGVYYLPAGQSSGYTGNLEVAVIPDAVKTALMAFVMDASNVMIELSEATAKLFGMTFEVATDDKARRLVYYKCQFGRPSLAASTSENSRTPQTDTAPITVMPTTKTYPFTVGEETIQRTVISGYSVANTNAAVYNAWHTKIHQPGESDPAAQGEG